MRTSESRPVAVAGDASTFHREPRAASALTAMLTTAALLRERTGLDTTAVLVPAESADELISGLRRVASSVGAIYLVHTHPNRARTAQTPLAGTVPVIIEEQTAAICPDDPIARLLAVPELVADLRAHATSISV